MKALVATTMVVALAFFGVAVSADAADKAPKTEQKMSLDQVPGPVRATLEKEAKGGSVGDVSLETNGKGKSYYEAHIQQPNGKDRYVHVSADGKVLKRESARKEARKENRTTQ